MKKLTRLTSLLLAVGMLFSFAACGTDPVDPADSDGDADTAETTPAETTADPLADNLPAETYDGEVITVWCDGGGKYLYYDPETEYVEGDVIHDAAMERNAAVTERFDVVLDFNRDLSVGWRDMSALRQSILGGDEYDLTEGPSLYQCPLAVYGCFTDLAANEYVNFEKPWWQSFATEALQIAGRQYRASGYWDHQTITRSNVIYFNANLVEDYELGNLYNLVTAGDWTFDKVIEMSEIVADDVNQDGVYDTGDNYGFFSRWDFMMGQDATTGYQYTVVQEDGTIRLTGLTEDLLKIHEKLYPFINNNSAYWSGYTYGKHPNYAAAAASDNAGKQMFCNDQILFALADMGWTESQLLRDFGAYGILPSPKYLEDQENYGTQTSSFSSGISVTTGNYDISSIILEALQVESYKILRPAYFDTALSYKYLNDPQSVAMLDLVFASVTCEFLYNFSMAGLTNLSVGLPTQANLASYFETNKSAVEAQLEQFMSQVDSIPEYVPQ